jgi:AAT family amino acid transporter
MSIVLITAILSTMLAAMFGLGRMIRSLANEGYAPGWLKDVGDIPRRGILFSGVAMLMGLGLGLILPQQVYLFLVSSGGFALLFSYVVILATHYKLRKRTGCPPQGNCQLPGYPITSWLALISSVLIIASMPLIPGQGAGLLAGCILILFFFTIYFINKYYLTKTKTVSPRVFPQLETQFETSEELTGKQTNLQQDREPK